MTEKHPKVRLDLLVYERGLADSREKARRLIMAGEVLSGDTVLTKPGSQVDHEIPLLIKEKLPFVSRGGYKLLEALQTFSINPEGWVCADVGASTGGFTDCLLQHGVAKVYAIDVGYGQLAWSLRQDSRVISMERQNVRFLEFLPEKVDFIVMDVSFISVELLLPVVKNWLKPDGGLVILVKPQFEAGKGDVGKGGVVKEANTHRDVLTRVTSFTQAQGYQILGLAISPITGPKGNIEFLLHLSASFQQKSGIVIDAAIEKVLARNSSE